MLSLILISSSRHTTYAPLRKCDEVEQLNMCEIDMWGKLYRSHKYSCISCESVSASGMSVILLACCNHVEDELAVSSATERTNNWRPHFDNRGRCIHGVTLEPYT